MKKGFILIYTIIIMGIMLIIIGSGFSSTLTETDISRKEKSSLMAFYSADTGIECVRFFQNNFRAFDPTSPNTTRNCGVGANFQTGGGRMSYNIPLAGFSNGACSNIRVTVVPRTIIVNGKPTTVYNLQVLSNGKNSCAANARNIVERTRWEDI